MKIAVQVISIVLISLFPAAAQSTVPTFREEITSIQKNLVAGLTGHDAVVSLTEMPDGERSVVRKDLIKFSDRQTIFARRLAERFIFRSLQRIGLKPKRHSYKTKHEGTNVYSIIPATVKSDEFVVLGAHYDSVKGSPGANDNASGTAVVFAVANGLFRLRERKRNFIVVFFDQEEMGLVGSRAFAQKLKNEGTILHSAHTVDQMGWDQDGDRAIELELPTPELESLYRAEAKKLSIPVHKTRVPSTDHTAFREIGFNAIGITEEYKNNDTTPHYHKDTDTYDTIDFGYLASSTELVYRVMRRLAEQ